MKLVRYGEDGAERPGLIDGAGTLRDLSGEVKDITPQTLVPAMLDRLRGLDPARLPAVPGSPRFGVPVAGIPKIVAVGQNYLDHIHEMGYQPPEEPVLFLKAISSLCGATDPIVKPKTSTQLDYEVELAVVIGRVARNVSEAEALDYVAGYALLNDGSERAYQRDRAGGTTKGKSADTLGPLGPWLVTADQVPDPQKLRLWSRVNGEPRQDGNTDNMVFSVAQIISYISEFMSLQPGDVVTTGSPHGVAAGFDPPRWLQPGDVLEMGIDGLGTQRHEIVAYDD